MDKRALKRELLLGLGWASSIAVGAGAFAAIVNVVYSYAQGYLQEGGSFVLGGTVIVVLSTALFVFPFALVFFWTRDFLKYRRKKREQEHQGGA